ncbi:MAG: helix-turn-helix domain-containing protein [Verrucomicrobiales bacterium]|nr:helix-turn-helix domain-containing protein [Verrucomicrobiales bacterium]
MTETQTAQILAHLKTGRSITPIDALNKYGCFRLGARIYDLKQDGHNIYREMVETDSGKRVASYTLVKP